MTLKMLVAGMRQYRDKDGTLVTVWRLKDTPVGDVEVAVTSRREGFAVEWKLGQTVTVTIE